MTLLALLCTIPTTHAHEGAPIEPHDLWTAWQTDPAILVGLGVAAWLYARGVRTLWARAGTGRGVRVWQAAAATAGLAALFVALLSPLDALGSALFSAHMAQHLVLVLLAAPLLVLGAPATAFTWALPTPWRGELRPLWRRASPLAAAWRMLTRPAVAWALHLAVVWAWHVPGLYQAALENDLVHALEHSSFLGTALLFWWALIHSGARRPSFYGLGVLYLFGAATLNGGLGALLTFARTPWYPLYAERVAAWGLTPLMDQQIAGLIMWMPSSLVYVAAASAFLALWLRGAEREAQRAEQGNGGARWSVADNTP